MFNPQNLIIMTEEKKVTENMTQFYATLPVWNITELCGYEPKTTFWMDFSIADRYGLDAIQDTYNRAFAGWKTNAVYLTEMVMVLNHKMWSFYQKDNDKYELYLKLYEQADQYAVRNLKDADLSYYYRTTD